MKASDHPLFRTYVNMKTRCFNKRNKAYPNYGGRGITVCDRWKSSFWLFLVDMGEKADHCHRLGDASLGEMEVGEVVQGLHEVRLQGEGGLVGAFRLRILAQRLQGDCLVEACGEMARIGGAGARVGRSGLGGTPLLVVGDPFREEVLGRRAPKLVLAADEKIAWLAALGHRRRTSGIRPSARPAGTPPRS